MRRYAHIGTGNYHSGTARLYGDLGMLTCDEDIGQDLTELFNYLTLKVVITSFLFNTKSYTTTFNVLDSFVAPISFGLNDKE